MEPRSIEVVVEIEPKMLYAFEKNQGEEKCQVLRPLSQNNKSSNDNN